MIVHPAVIVHGLADAEAVLSVGVPVTLLSAPGAAGFAGCLWWKTMIAGARRHHPGVDAVDVLDCADAAGYAMAALRSDVVRLVLAPGPAWAAVQQIATRQGGYLLDRPPPALDMAARDGRYRLRQWLLQA
jgi:hypothetical protein